ncbi:hypothetical protein GGR50DRAFT_320462 [Xylaria sp. CBS 124048]|nr:hypothetical protein GGR50DRAFT_320462 [Xylaria sp. CBS 124048]
MDDQRDGRRDDGLGDDQFGGRTDDDLFADDFEPVPVAVPESQPNTSAVSTSPPTETKPAAAVIPAQSSKPDAPAELLAGSRHARPAQQKRLRKQSPDAAAPSSSTATTAPSDPSSTPTPTPTLPAKVRPGSNTALVNRIASGANPRTKLSETELVKKMEQMRILSAEKARKFEQAEEDSRSHALAYEKGMEEAKRRHAEEAEKRKRGEEERRQMDQERAANRERKLKAMGARGGGWDEGKPAEDEREHRGFKAINAGLRGSRHAYDRNAEPPAEDEREQRGFKAINAGLRGSRHAYDRNTEQPTREFAPDEYRGRGRGRGRGGSRGGRGGRGGFAERNASPYNAPTHQQQQQQQHPKPEQKPPTADDFPALPTPNAERDTTTEAAESISWSALMNSSSKEKVNWDEM